LLRSCQHWHAQRLIRPAAVDSFDAAFRFPRLYQQQLCSQSNLEIFVGVAKKPQHLGAPIAANIGKLPELLRKT
jgi:hypothetical protein